MQQCVCVCVRACVRACVCVCVCSKPLIQHKWENAISGVQVSPRTADTLVMWGEKINRCLRARSISNIATRSYHNRLTYVEATASDINVFFGTQCTTATTNFSFSSLRQRGRFANETITYLFPVCWVRMAHKPWYSPTWHKKWSFRSVQLLRWFSKFFLRETQTWI